MRHAAVGVVLRCARVAVAGAGGRRSAVGGHRIEVVNPLRSLRLIRERRDLSMNMTWDDSFEAVLEKRNVLLEGTRAMWDDSRFAQVGSWPGGLPVDGREFSVDSDVWLGPNFHKLTAIKGSRG